MFALLWNLAEDYGVKIETTITSDIVIQADYIKLKQILINLMSNAIKYNKQGGRVTLDIEKIENGYVRINVSDTGIGIKREKHDQVFTAFSRLGHEASQIEGAGVGLVIIKVIVEAMTGRIGFVSIEGKGSIFWFELPLIKG